MKGSRRETDLALELSYHLDRRVQELIAAGESAEEARRLAAIEFGGMAQVQEEVREVWMWRWLRVAGRDLSYAGRLLRGSPGFAITAILSLALGIGANTAIFSILDALVLRSLPVSDPQRLVVVTRNQVSVPYPLYVEFRKRSQTLEGVLAFRTAACRLRTGDAAERITGALVSGGYFEVLGVRPLIGTSISSEDDQHPGSGGWRGPVAVISYVLWMRRFGGDPSIAGARITLNESPFTVAGVAPEGFRGTEVGEAPDVFVPMTMQPVILPSLANALSLRASNWIRIIGRLNFGIDKRTAEAELTGLLRQYNEETIRSVGNLDANRRRSLLEQRITLLPGDSGISGLREQYAKPLWVLMTVMGLVLLIACANVANLLLSRAGARRREIAIRLGLGAARSRLVVQLFTESLVLAAAGGVTGLFLARWLRDAIVTYLPPERSLAAPLDIKVLLFTMALAAGAALLFGLAPALQSTNVDVAPALKGEEMAAGRMRAAFRKGLVVFQISLSWLLLVAAGLFLRSLHNLTSLDPGFDRQNVMVASVDAGIQIYPRLLEEARRLPGVVSAALADSAPLGTHTGWSVFVPGYAPKANEPKDSPSVAFVSTGYFETMKVPLLAGRDFDEHEVASRRNVMVVNDAFAKHFFAGENPVGRKLGVTAGVYDYEIVGVVKDGKYTGLREEPVRMMYVPYRPGPWAGRMVVHLRSAGNLTAVAPALRKKVRELDPNAPVFQVHTVQDEIDLSLSRERLTGTVTGLFGALALVLAGIGLYGMMAYGVSRRRREFGIRMAVGAHPGSVVRLVIREALTLVAAGLAVGMAAALIFGRLVTSMLFGVQPADPASVAMATGVLASASLAAALIPAWRASRVAPTEALRQQ